MTRQHDRISVRMVQEKIKRKRIKRKREHIVELTYIMEEIVLSETWDLIFDLQTYLYTSLVFIT